MESDQSMPLSSQNSLTDMSFPTRKPKRCLANMTDNAVKNRFSVLHKRIMQQESSNKENNAPDVNTGSQYRLVHHTIPTCQSEEPRFVGVQVQCTKDLQQNDRFHYHHLPMQTEFLIRRSLRTLILLRALNVTIEDVCGALLEGRSDTLRTELLESLLKMHPRTNTKHYPFVIEASSSNDEYRRSNSVFNEGDTNMYNNLGDCNQITAVKSTEICSHKEDWESRHARMKMTKGFIAEESVKGHILLFHDLFAKAIPYMMQEYVKMLYVMILLHQALEREDVAFYVATMIIALPLKAAEAMNVKFLSANRCTNSGDSEVQAFDALDGHQRGILETRPYHIVSVKSVGLDTNITTWKRFHDHLANSCNGIVIQKEQHQEVCQRITVTVISKEQQKGFREETKPGREGLEMRTSKEFLVKLQENTYHGTLNEDVVEHIAKVLEMVDLIYAPGTDSHQLQMKVCPLSLAGDANKCISNNDKSKYENPPNTGTNSFFKAYDVRDIEEEIRQEQMKRKNNDCDNKQPSKKVCKTEKFEAIKYSLGPDEEYIAVKRCEHNTWERDEDCISKIYQENFQMKDEGWKVTRTE
ncbi:hypothetical protein Tco_0783829 [Tanacetum coccineum]